MRMTHTWTDEAATIRIEGLSQTVRMLHITDSHVALIDDRDAAHQAACESYCERMASRDETFRKMLADADGLDLDVVALTGDIIHFPSQASVENAVASISQIDVPALYTAGNHDWHFPGVDGRDELRDAWWPALEPLHHGGAAYARYEINGIQFLLVDDSTYRIDQEQLTFVKTHLASPIPTVLLTHIPVSLPTLRDPTIERWNAPILIGDPDWEFESRDRWGTGENPSSTLEFVRTLAAAENLVALFCGHIHFPHTDAISPNAVQYVGAPGYDAKNRLVEFQPL